MTPFLILFGLDVLIGASVLYLFLTTAAVPVAVPMPVTPWLLVMSALAAILMGALQLQRRGHPRLAVGVLLIPAVPAVLAVAGLIAVMVLFSLNTPHH